MGTVIKAIAAYLPETIRTNEDIVASGMTSYDEDAILHKTGIASRHVALEEESTSDLALQAAERLFSLGVVERSEIDWLIVCTQTPDYMLPTMACLLQDRLELPAHCCCFDLNLACTGFVYSLVLADSLLASGKAERILLINADTYTKFLSPKDADVTTIFGDGATATLLISGKDEGIGLLGMKLGTDGSGYDQLIRRYGGSRNLQSARTSSPDDPGNYITMQGSAIFRFVQATVPENVNELIEERRTSLDDVDVFLFHQASRYMLETLQRRMKVTPDKMPIDLETTGNTVSASIPLLVHRMLSKDPNALSNKLAVFCGFGAGLSYGSVLYRFPKENVLCAH